MAAWTYDTLKQAIFDYVESDEATFVADIDIIINQAEDRIVKSVQLPSFRKNVTGTVTQDDQYLAQPTDYLSPYSLAVDNSGLEYLLFKDVSYIREVYPVSTVTGTPKVYALFDDDFFIMGPTPDTTYQVELHYFYKPESIVTASTSWMGDNAYTALLYGCLLEASTFQMGDQDLVTLYATRYEEAMSNLKLLGEGRNRTDSYRNG